MAQNFSNGGQVGEESFPVKRNHFILGLSMSHQRNISDSQGRFLVPSWKDVFLTRLQKASNRVARDENINRLRGVPGPQGWHIFPPLNQGSLVAPVSPAPVPIVVDPPTSPCSPSTSRGASTFHGEIFDDVEQAVLTTFQSRTTGG